MQLTRDASLNWTTAQKSDMRNYHVGQFLGFQKNVRGIRKHETVEVVNVEGTQIIVRKENGESRILTRKQAKAFDVFQRQAIEVAAGDKLILTANRGDPALRATNGEIVIVSLVDEERRIHLEDGRVLPSNFKQFTHGYAVTAHRSQGKSVDAVIISADGMRKELFYVAASRGREHISIITSDKDRLRETIAQSSARKSASELARQRRPTPRERMQRRIVTTAAVMRHIETEISRPIQPSRDKAKVEKSHERGISR